MRNPGSRQLCSAAGMCYMCTFDGSLHIHRAAPKPLQAGQPRIYRKLGNNSPLKRCTSRLVVSTTSDHGLWARCSVFGIFLGHGEPMVETCTSEKALAWKQQRCGVPFHARQHLNGWVHTKGLFYRVASTEL